jgi:branched-chain amino acid transport system ATP-binding protein
MRGFDIEVTNLSAGYAGRSVVTGLSFRLNAGDRLGIIGRNGAGKTTTIGCLMGLVEQQSGNVKFGLADVSHWAAHRRARVGVGYVPQTRDIFRSLTVEENLISAAHRRDLLGRLELVYQLFPRLKERRRNGGTELSGGEQQMLAVGRALITDPQVLMLDEPLEGLSPKIRKELMASIERLADDLGISCIFVEQHVDVVLSFCSQVLILEQGKTVFAGSAALLRQNSEILDTSIGLKKTARHAP